MSRERSVSDAIIVREVLSGDREAFRTLVERHQRRVYHCALRIARDPEEAEDIAQEALLKAYTNLGRYDERWAFSTWVLTIATRTALNTVRARRGRPAQNVEDLAPSAQPVDEKAGPRDRAAQSEWFRRLAGEIDRLSEKMRLVFSLRHEDDLSIREIARATDTSESAVKVMLHRARKILRDRLREYSDFA